MKLPKPLYRIYSNKRKEPQKAYDVKIKELQDKESDLKHQRAALGIFAFSKKKELDAKILECQDEISAFKKSDNTQKLKNEYEQISYKVHLLDI